MIDLKLLEYLTDKEQEFLSPLSRTGGGGIIIFAERLNEARRRVEELEKTLEIYRDGSMNPTITEIMMTPPYIELRKKFNILKEQNDQLREALEPFAKLCGWEGGAVLKLSLIGEPWGQIPAKNIRKARDILAQTAPEGSAEGAK